jgi:hypothetical protein
MALVVLYMDRMDYAGTTNGIAPLHRMLHASDLNQRRKTPMISAF